MRALAIGRIMRLGAGAAVLGAAVVVPTTVSGAASTAAAPKYTVTIAADHLNNPRGVSIGTGGRVLVAEAGNGNPTGGKCAVVTDPDTGDKSTMCFGLTGAITAVQGTTVTRVLKNLPSIAPKNGQGADGPVYAQDVAGGKISVVMQGIMSGTPTSWNPYAKTTFGDILSNSTPQPALNLTNYEKAHDPAHDGVDSDAYSESVGAQKVFVDAGGNDVLMVKNGVLTTLAVFKPQTELVPGSNIKIPQESVPTSIVAMPDGSYLVGELTGYPYTPGSARIWRVVPGKAPTVWKTGFTNIVGLARGSDGSIYVSEIAQHGLRGAYAGGDTSGGLFRVAPNGTKTQIQVPGLKWAGGVAVASNGTIYVANCSIGPPSASTPCHGQLLKVS